MSDAVDTAKLMLAREIADRVVRRAGRIRHGEARELALGFVICDRQRAEFARMRQVYDAAMAFVAAPHVMNPNHFAGDHDECEAPAAEAELRRVASLVTS